MVRRKDPLWDHVDELDNQRFRCKFCGRNFAGGIPRIKSHLSCITGRGIDVCVGVPDDVRDYAISEIGQPSKRARTATTSVDIRENGASTSSTKRLSGTVQKISMPAMHGNDRTAADKNLARFLLYSNIPYDVLDAPCFSDFIRSVAECSGDYKLPSSSMLETTIFPDIKAEVETHVRNVKESWMDSGCTVLIEVWHNSITIIAYSFKGAVFMKSIDSISEKSDFDIKDTVSSVIEDIGYDNVVQLITNNDRVFHSVGGMLGDLYPRIYMTRCVAHEIHLLLKNIYDNVGWVKLVIDQAALVVKYMYGDANILSLMRKFTSSRELKHLCMSKFASNYIMLRSIFNNETELRELVASGEWSFLHENSEREDKVTEIIQSEEFWTQGQDVQNVMKPFIQVLCLVEDERSTSAYVYEAMESAKEAIEGICSKDQMKYEKILEIFEERRRDHIIHPIHAAAAFLNPAYMCHGNFKENREMKAGVDFILYTIVRDNEKRSFSKQFQLYRAKASELFTKEAYEMLEMHHPGLWWDYRGDCFPVLQKYATRILRQPCKCSLHLKCSAFVTAADVKMSATARDAWEKDECMKMNAMMMEKFRFLCEQNLEPIELQSCSELPDYVTYDKGCGDDVDSCDDCNKINGSGQVINARLTDHTTNQLDVFCKPSLSTGVANNSGAFAECMLKAPASAPVPEVVAASSVSVPQCQVLKRPRTVDFASQWTEIVDPGECWSITLPDTTKTTSKVVQLLYTNYSQGILSLQSNGAQNLWKWPCNVQNPRGKATARAIPQRWLPNNGLMTNDILGVNLEEAVPCMALSNNNAYVVSAAGGKVSVFDLFSFRVSTSFMPSPSASTCLALHPHHSNVLAIGMEDSRICIVRNGEVQEELKGHEKRITGLAFSNFLTLLVSSGADAQLCIWSAYTWEKMGSVTIQIPAGKTPTSNDTRVQFHSDQMRLLVVHETHLTVYDASSSKMDCVCQWIPGDELPAPITCATYSCNSRLIYATFNDGNIGVFDADTLRLGCRIASSAYMLSQEVSNGAQNVHPLVVVAHPMEPNQIAIGLSNGSVKVMEPTGHRLRRTKRQA